MDRYLVIGNPIAHSLSPEIHARFARSLGERISYERLRVDPEEFEAQVRGCFDEGVRGANVTLPFKLRAFNVATRITDRAQLARAANFLAARDGVIEADNTDGAGLVADLTRNLGLQLRGARIVLLGAGGAARGVVGPLLDEGPEWLTVANRTHERAIELRHGFPAHSPMRVCSLDRIPADATLVINATSTSTLGQDLALPEGTLRAGMFAYDMAYGPSARAFVERARSTGANASDGLGMLVEQAAESYYLWRGLRPETGPVLAELRTLVA